MPTVISISKLTYIPLLLLLFCISPVFAQTGSGHSNRLVPIQGHILNAYFNEQVVEVKRISPKSFFYGYGWIDDHRVFVAFQPHTNAAAIAEIEVIDLNTKNTASYYGVGAVGESRFDVSPTGRIIFNHFDGIKELKFTDDFESYQEITLVPGVNCWGAFWVDATTVGCAPPDESKEKIVTYSLK